MDIKDTPTPYQSDNILLSDSNYYKYIFKKTEKICCVVFYILAHADKGQHSSIADDVRESAKRALDAALATLSCQWYAAHDELFALLHALFALESNIHVAQAVALIQEAVADTLSLEMEAVMRTLRPYLEAGKKGISDFSSFPGDGRLSATVGFAPRARKDASSEDVRNARHVAEPFRPPVDAGQGQSKGQVKGQRIERRRAIKDTLAVKGQVTIKDILEKMPDFSEKTLQRELISMINEGVVVKDGERRWRRYSLVSGT